MRGARGYRAGVGCYSSWFIAPSLSTTLSCREKEEEGKWEKAD